MSREIVALSEDERDEVFEVINAAAQRYEGVNPARSDIDPYISLGELYGELDEMQFYGAVRDRLEGVIGLQEQPDVSLIRRLYVRPSVHREGIGTDLLETGIERAASETVLVGTWEEAEWALEFYEDNGFGNLGAHLDLLSTYWEIPDQRREASVVLRYET